MVGFLICSRILACGLLGELPYCSCWWVVLTNLSQEGNLLFRCTSFLPFSQSCFSIPVEECRQGSSFLSGFFLGGETGLGSATTKRKSREVRRPRELALPVFLSGTVHSPWHRAIQNCPQPAILIPSHLHALCLPFLLAKFVIPRHHRRHLHLCLLSLPVEVTMLKVAAWGELGSVGKQESLRVCTLPLLCLGSPT